ncbi:pentatricopeptide repeat-containing protein At4g16390, chloroplastic [Impatiens glandulifera]|uniref:pentatricopeptide repeat-containing protein At4g16390, chloroplastic n=1 Tax=Impatiens glandulifera TaxID=253017 RepID=UPI001FB07FF8|nr:pentatricopeptide repeat-containing protein At4g16390, chloroplastic [Impatiens glandulifera]
MDCHVFSSPSALLSLKFDSFKSFRSLKQLNYTLKCDNTNLNSRTSLRVSQFSVQEPTSEETHDFNSFTSSISPLPDVETASSSSSKNVWINPRSARASQLRLNSYDARYAFLSELAESLNSCPPLEQEVFRILSGLGDMMVEQDAVIILNNMSSTVTATLALKYFQQKLKLTKEVILYNVTLKVFKKNKDLTGAENLFDEMLKRGVKPDKVTFSTIISCARVSSLPEKAVEWFEKMPTHGCEPDDVNYTVMIDAYGRAGNIEMALKLYDRARAEKWRIDAVTFSTLIKIYGMSLNFDGCLNVYEEMKALNIKPNVVVYNTLLDAMGRAKRPWQAKTIYKEMTTNGFEPSWATHAALIRAYGKARYGEDALTIYRQMRKKGMEMNVTLYNTLLSMCADLGLVEEATEIFEDMNESGSCKPDTWTFSSMITVYSCCGKVLQAEAMLNLMKESGFNPNIFVLTSLIQCYGKANLTDDVVRMFDLTMELGITPDDRFCSCLLNVMTQTPKEELGRLIGCVEKANTKLSNFVNGVLLGTADSEVLKKEAKELLGSISNVVKKAYCNCLIDLCVNLDMLEKACELLEVAMGMGIYNDLQMKTSTQWSLHLKSLSLGAALTALHIWMNDLSRALEKGEEFPPMLGINTGHGKHKYSDKGLASVFETHLKELDAPFHEATDKVGWFLTTKVAAVSWLESRRAAEALEAVVAAK